MTSLAPQSPAGVPGGAPAGPALRIVGLDLSLSATGIAEIHLGEARTWHLKVAGNGHDRMATLLDRIWLAVSGADVVAVEGPSYGSGTNGRQSGHHERAGLWWLVTHTLLRRQGIPWTSVPPATLKRWGAGKGNAPKDAMLIAAVRRFPDVDVADNNEADALFLAAAAADWYGCPLVTMPAVQRAALEAVEWPTLAQIAGVQ